MAKRPVFAPRRDEVALGRGGAFSQRTITYLENLSELTNAAPQDLEDQILGALGGNSQAGVAMAQGVETDKLLNDALNSVASLQSDSGALNAITKELSKPLADLFNIVAELISMTGTLSAENNKIRKEIEDLKQLHGGL